MNINTLYIKVTVFREIADVVAGILGDLAISMTFRGEEKFVFTEDFFGDGRDCIVTIYDRCLRVLLVVSAFSITYGTRKLVSQVIMISSDAIFLLRSS